MERDQQYYYSLFDDNYKRKGKLDQASNPVKRASLYYRGYDPKFHNYTIYNGETYVKMTKKSLRMGKKACEDWASLLWSEKLDLSIKNKEKAIQYLVDLGFWRIGSKAVELSFGLGISCVAVSIDVEFNQETGEPNAESGKIGLRYYDGQNIVPIQYDQNDEVSEVALFSEKDGVITMTAYIKDDSGNYIIAVVTKEGEKKEYMELQTNNPNPMFAVFHPNVVDNQTQHFHGYASILQNSIDTLQAIDNAFDGMDQEVNLGKKRIFASAALNKIVFEKVKDANGNETQVSKTRRTFDPNDTIIYALPETNSTENDKPFVYSPNDPLRIDQFTMDLTFNMQLFSQQVGLGANYYRFDGGRIMTATQVISQNSDTYRNVKKHEQVLEPAIKRLYRGIAVASRLFTKDSPLAEDLDVEVAFDDSIIEDRQTEKESDTKDLANGVISKAEFRAKWYNEDSKEAAKKINAIAGDEEIASRFNSLAAAIASSVLTTRLAVFIIFDGKEEILKKAGYKSIDEYAKEVENAKPSISADDLLGFNNRSNDGAKNEEDKPDGEQRESEGDKPEQTEQPPKPEGGEA